MVNQKVGAIYECALNDVGYMLADNPQRPVRRQTGVLDTQPPGSDDPLSERIGRYDMIGQSDWTGGEGQELADRPASDPTRFHRAEFVFPFNVGQISVIGGSTHYIESTLVSLAIDSGGPRAVVAGGSIYLQTTGDDLTVLDTPAGTPTEFATGLAGSINSMASDGTYWYATDGLTIRRNNTGADPAANWSTEDVTEIAWCVDRLMGMDKAASPEEVLSFSPTGTGTVLALTHGTGFDLRAMCGGDGYFWYGANKGDGGHVRYWQFDSDPINTGVALVLPANETVDNLFFYLGNVFVSTTLTAGDDVGRRIYRCVPSDGVLTPQLAVEVIKLDQELSVQRTFFTGTGKYVYFGWPEMVSGSAGIGVFDLETGGYARYWAPDVASFNLGGVVTWYGHPGLVLESATAATGGFWGTDVPHVSNLQVGVLTTSIFDLGTPALKHLDEVSLSSWPLTSGDEIMVEYSIDNGDSFTTLTTFDTVGDTRHSYELPTEVVAASFQFRITLTPAASGFGPVVTGFVAKTHATGIIDEIIELPINCDDYIADVNDTPIAGDSGPGKGMARYRALQALIGEKVTFQDVDWKVTADTSLVEVVGVESTSVQVFNQNRVVSDTAGHVAVVTLRRPYVAS